MSEREPLVLPIAQGTPYSAFDRLYHIFSEVRGGRFPSSDASGDFSEKSLGFLGKHRFGFSEVDGLLRTSSQSAYVSLLQKHRDPGVILEIGSGDGAFSSRLAGSLPASERYIATELVREGLGVYRDRAKRSSLAGFPVIASGDALPISTCSVNTVVSIASFDVMDRPTLERVISEIDRVLLPGGRIIFAIDLLPTEALAFISRFDDIQTIETALGARNIPFRVLFPKNEVDEARHAITQEIRSAMPELKRDVRRGLVHRRLRSMMAEITYHQILISILNNNVVPIALELGLLPWQSLPEGLGSPFGESIRTLSRSSPLFMKRMEEIKVDQGDGGTTVSCDPTTFLGLSAILAEDYYDRRIGSFISGVDFMSLLRTWLSHEMNLIYIISLFAKAGFKVDVEGWQVGDTMTNEQTRRGMVLQHINFAGMPVTIARQGDTRPKAEYATSIVRYVTLSRSRD